MALLGHNLDQELEEQDQALSQSFEQFRQALVNQQEGMGHCQNLIVSWLERVICFIETGYKNPFLSEPMVTPERYEEYITACHEERVKYHLCYNAGRPCVSVFIEHDDDSDKQKEKTLAVIDINTRLQVI